MALFKRDTLRKQGFSEEQIEYIMTESGRSLANNYTPTAEVQGQIDAAVKAAGGGTPPDITQTAEYQQIANERDMLRAINGEDFAGVKPKFRETVFGMLDRGDNAPAIAEQLKNIGEKYEEYFTAAPAPEDNPPAKPQFGTPTQGGAPSGKSGPSFEETWGFVPAKK